MAGFDDSDLVGHPILFPCPPTGFSVQHWLEDPDDATDHQHSIAGPHVLTGTRLGLCVQYESEHKKQGPKVAASLASLVTAGMLTARRYGLCCGLHLVGAMVSALMLAGLAIARIACVMQDRVNISFGVDGSAINRSGVRCVCN